MSHGGCVAMNEPRWQRRRGTRFASAMAAFLLLDCGASRAQTTQTQKTSQSSPSDLTQVSIENLMNLEVTSVSKKEQKLSQVAAAIFVITAENIRRSEDMRIPDSRPIVP